MRKQRHKAQLAGFVWFCCILGSALACEHLGEDTSEKILKGQLVQPNDRLASYAVSIMDPDPEIGQYCSGVVVARDIILTAGGNLSLAPQNIPVGRVVNVVPRSTAEGPLLEVEPYADLGALNFVSVVLYKSALEVTPTPEGTQAGD